MDKLQELENEVASLKKALAEAEEKVIVTTREANHWLKWAGGRWPDDSPGDVVAAYEDGTIVLDDGINTWNPLRALKFIKAERDITLEQFAKNYPCHCAGNYPGSKNYHGSDCENAIAQEFVADWIAKAGKP